MPNHNCQTIINEADFFLTVHLLQCQLMFIDRDLLGYNNVYKTNLKIYKY